MSLGLAACASAVARPPLAYFQMYEVAAPTLRALTICSAYGCKRKTRVVLRDADLAALKRIMRSGTRSAKAERAAIATAVAWMERRVGRQIGTIADKDYRDFVSDGDPTQLDCIDEAANTTSVLVLLDEMDLLRYHEVAHPRSRGFIIDGRYPHVTAVLIEKENGQDWAVDSWILAGGEKPIVMKYDEWYVAPTPDMYASREIS
jgi:hypothetical protein